MKLLINYKYQVIINQKNILLDSKLNADVTGSYSKGDIDILMTSYYYKAFITNGFLMYIISKI